MIIDDDKLRVVAAVCLDCKYWEGGDVCEAFPNGIPDEIFIHGNVHKEPMSGDHGIQFEVVP